MKFTALLLCIGQICCISSKKFLQKSPESPVFVRLYSSWCYYTSFVDAADDSGCFHIKTPFASYFCKSSICRDRHIMRTGATSTAGAFQIRANYRFGAGEMVRIFDKVGTNGFAKLTDLLIIS